MNTKNQHSLVWFTSRLTRVNKKKLKAIAKKSDEKIYETLNRIIEDAS